MCASSAVGVGVTNWDGPAVAREQGTCGMAHSREGRVTAAPCLWGSCAGPAQSWACTQGLLVASTGTLEGLGAEASTSVWAQRRAGALCSRGPALSLSSDIVGELQGGTTCRPRGRRVYLGLEEAGLDRP